MVGVVDEMGTGDLAPQLNLIGEVREGFVVGCLLAGDRFVQDGYTTSNSNAKHNEYAVFGKAQSEAAG